MHQPLTIGRAFTVHSQQLASGGSVTFHMSAGGSRAEAVAALNASLAAGFNNALVFSRCGVPTPEPD
jgi:hypothetical protein